MLYSNKQIYIFYHNLLNFNFNGVLPIRINFYLHKNLNIIKEAYNAIENMRATIVKTYGQIAEDGISYVIIPEKEQVANQEFRELLNLEQELNLHIFKLNEFENIELTYEQFEAISFMIEE